MFQLQALKAQSTRGVALLATRGEPAPAAAAPHHEGSAHRGIPRHVHTRVYAPGKGRWHHSKVIFLFFLITD